MRPTQNVKRVSITAGTSLLCLAGWWSLQAQDLAKVNHADCSFFGAQHERFLKSGIEGERLQRFPLSTLTTAVARQVAYLSTEQAHSQSLPALDSMGLIDKYIFKAIQDAGVKPAPKTNDYEFIRRVTLDLTGRIPTATEVATFAADSSSDKRARLIDSLLASQPFVDKWTMYFGDLYKNTLRTQSSGVIRYAPGRNAFYKWIHDSIANGKPYNQMATEILSATGDNSYNQGELNWMVGGTVRGTRIPIQDTFDQQAVNAAETFLGISHLNCLECHNGRGHLDSLSLWGSRTTRWDAWQMASFFSHSLASNKPVGDQPQPYYWQVQNDVAGARTDYPLNTTTGNRPARQPYVDSNNKRWTTAPPLYIFSNKAPRQGEDYRAVFARELTSDIQFSRATVNYIWKELFGRGIVDPPDQFDPARLDPQNPHPSPWTLQPSHPELLNALAQAFVDNKYDLRWLLRTLANSEAYQLSSRYDGTWDPSSERLFARKLVRRLWAEEIHDAIVQTSGLAPSYNLGDTTLGTNGRTPWAMQLPEPDAMPDGANGAVSLFLNSFLRGNRDDQVRKGDGSLTQALSLMNDNFVVSRTKTTTVSGQQSTLMKLNQLGSDQLVDTLYMMVLSRPPRADEKKTALLSLQSGARNQKAEDLLWTLYNKVDFIFNY